MSSWENEGEETDRPLAPQPEAEPGSRRWKASCTRLITEDPLLALTLLGVVLGMLTGAILISVLPNNKDSEMRVLVVKLVEFPGQAFLNLLKLMVLPLIAGSMIAGVVALNEAGAETGKLARLTLSYFAGTTFIAVLIGLFLVQVIQPGSGSGEWHVEKDSGNTATEQKSTLETILDVLLKMFPPNIVEAAATMNILGVLVFSLFFGAMLARVGPSAQPLIQIIHIFNEVIMKMVLAILWLSPIGISCLIASQMCEQPNLLETLKFLGHVQSLSLYAFTVVLGLGLHGFVVLPALYYFYTKKSPVLFIRDMSQAMVTAFGTDSSSATLPVTMLCCEKYGIPTQITKFVLPLGATVNMNGTALYEALTVIFIAQRHSVPLGIGHLFVVAATSCLAAIGAAAIPSAGLVTMVMVLQATGLDQYSADLSIIFAIDWALDRCRTTVNVLSDSIGAAIVHHVCFGGSSNRAQGHEGGYQMAERTSPATVDVEQGADSADSGAPGVADGAELVKRK